MKETSITWVYIVKPSLQNIYKIGCTKDIDTRLKDLQVANFDKLEIVHAFETNDPLIAEQLLHKIFENKKVRGEWYQLDPVDIAFLSRINGYTNSFVWNTSVVNLESMDCDYTKSFSVSVNNIPTTEGLQTIYITEDQIRKFLNTAEKRELKGKCAFSRSYWTKQHRPRLRTHSYQAMIKLLCDNKLILNREERRSGNMALTPNQCLDRIKNNTVDPFT